MQTSFAACKEATPTCKVPEWVSCVLAEGPQVSVHVDGSSLGNPGPTSFGGLVRNSDGKWLWGFKGDIGMDTSLKAELLAILHDLQLCWTRRYLSILLVSDSKMALELVKQPIQYSHGYAGVLCHIKELMAKPWTLSLIHSWREGNMCANMLAKMGPNSRIALLELEEPPTGLEAQLFADAMGLPVLRD
ncbi:uncharacterized protein LOC109791774 [Cajanus cajan]|uniref:Ribonuclease H protein At1g65750 family n=1 Tax=Cajanus cajan TaxID=3821 RepID=A0A151QX99_CAJCA|nr:uncharacterized protein LOC109791774 [Cajanus cajan]KYP34896.1 Putative ribonuclease H protein At1g65750 family [Cajanus cajan]